MRPCGRRLQGCMGLARGDALRTLQPRGPWEGASKRQGQTATPAPPRASNEPIGVRMGQSAFGWANR
eukprot:6142632-Prymnesium_polylepis.1